MSPRTSAGEIDTATMPTLDVRTKAGKEQIRGALRYDPKILLSASQLTLPLPHDGRIVVYGDTEEQAQRVAARLREEGYVHAGVLDGGSKRTARPDCRLRRLRRSSRFRDARTRAFHAVSR